MSSDDADRSGGGRIDACAVLQSAFPIATDTLITLDLPLLLTKLSLGYGDVDGSGAVYPRATAPARQG